MEDDVHDITDGTTAARPNHRNRNIVLAVIGAVLVLCCCCAVLFGALGLVFYARNTGSSATRPQASESVIMVTPEVAQEQAATQAPELVTTPEPPATPTDVAPVEAPIDATPVPEAGVVTETVTGTTNVDTAALLAEAAMPIRDQRALALRLKPGVGNIPATVNPTPPTYKVGDTASFWVENSDTQEHQQISATLRYITPHVYTWVQNGVNLDLNALKHSADRFESKTYPTDREFFGSEWTPGVDNDVHLSILHATGMGENIAGYYSSADEFSHLINPYSNEREMFYIAADKTQPNTSFYDGVLAHEFQHMIHWANDRNEDSWVNEGMSELAGHLNGFDTGGNEYAYAERPDTQLNTWEDPSKGNAEHYGASYLFMDYFLNRFGENLTKAVVANQENGIAGFNDALIKAGRAERFDDIFADWLIANYLNQPKANPKGHFGYADIEPPVPAIMETYNQFPASNSTQVSQYGADYIELQGSGNLTVDFKGQTTAKLVNTSPHGQYAWWSNRGDDSDATLTRAFDLSNLSTATLTFSAWYDIEDGWDYAYVEASTDGGKHWQILPGQQTSDKNPVGNAFGPGWTGISGGGKAPAWVNEKVDLSAFAGKQVLLRFEYITDDAVNGPGFMIDDLAIPELNYTDNGEKGTAGWDAAGWLLTNNQLDQHWLVQLVTSNQSGVQVQRMQVGANGQGSLSLPNAGSYDHAMLIVSALAPVTTERASYSYNITSK
jgi:immune inhibitor A